MDTTGTSLSESLVTFSMQATRGHSAGRAGGGMSRLDSGPCGGADAQGSVAGQQGAETRVRMDTTPREHCLAFTVLSRGR